MADKTNFQKVREFMRVMGQDKDSGRHLCNLKKGLTLIDEEYKELKEAVEQREHLIDILKELTDLIYVCYWTAAKLGIDMDKAFDLVHQSNLSKLDPETGKPIYREDGKVLKGPNYKAADMSILLT